jgi:UDP-glucose 4-epimerase
MIEETVRHNIKRVMGWLPRYDDIGYIIETAWNWEKRQ